MQLISAERIKEISVLQDSGTVSGLNFSLVRRALQQQAPVFPGVPQAPGWVKSPVPITFTPLIVTTARAPGDMSGLVAREYFECTWKSVINFMVDYKEYGAEMKIKGCPSRNTSQREILCNL